jgi:ABC-type nitrate/sulfonate/bicarbonate transport system permease component
MRPLNALVNAASIAAILVIWYLITAFNLVPRVFVPSPVAVYAKIVTGLTGGLLLTQTVNTVLSMLVGWLACSALGVALGSLIGYARERVVSVVAHGQSEI